jgi:hypothetical protein
MLWHLAFNQLPKINEQLVTEREDIFFGAEFDASAGTHKLPDDTVRRMRSWPRWQRPMSWRKGRWRQRSDTWGWRNGRRRQCRTANAGSSRFCSASSGCCMPASAVTPWQ